MNYWKEEAERQKKEARGIAWLLFCMYLIGAFFFGILWGVVLPIGFIVLCNIVLYLIVEGSKRI
jgi:hypothetical protein